MSDKKIIMFGYPITIPYIVRNTTKLKAILLKYSIFLEMSDDGIMKMTLVDKVHLDEEWIQAKSYSQLIGMAYSHLLRALKKEELKLKS